MSSMYEDGVYIGGYRMRASPRRHTPSASRNNTSGMTQTGRATCTEQMNGTVRSETMQALRSSSRRIRINSSSSSNVRQRYVRNIRIQFLIRRDQIDASVYFDYLEVVLISSLVLTLRSTGVWLLNMLRHYIVMLLFPYHRQRQNIYKNLPTIAIEEEGVQCSICLRDFNIGDRAKCLPCDHKFHSSCIRPWLKRAVTCPNCRHHVVPAPSYTSALRIILIILIMLHVMLQVLFAKGFMEYVEHNFWLFYLQVYLTVVLLLYHMKYI